MGPYEVGPKIGRGGMADVYVARDLRRDAEIPVIALKVIKSELVLKDRYYLDLFLDEAKILERLRHPNLIRVFEAGVTTEHRFIAMELLLGRSLADVFDLLAARGERIPFEVGALICMRVAEGLHHAHELVDPDNASYELVHRDVNPSNIFLTFDGRVKLIDFGLARSRGTQARAPSGVVKGKVAYLAPEQLTSKTADRRIDIYQLCITLWELATGKRLYKKDTPEESLRAIQQGVVPVPSTLAPDVPTELSSLIMRALAYDPDRRFTTMNGLARALESIVRASPTPVDLAGFLETVFPGQRAELDRWYDDVSGKTLAQNSTVYPPAPVPSGDAIGRAGSLAGPTTPAVAASMPAPALPLVASHAPPAIVSYGPPPVSVATPPATVAAAPTFVAATGDAGAQQRKLLLVAAIAGGGLALVLGIVLLIVLASR